VQAAQPYPAVERLVADCRWPGASLCQRRQPPEAMAEGQRLQRLGPASDNRPPRQTDCQPRVYQRLRSEAIKYLKLFREQNANHLKQRRAIFFLESNPISSDNTQDPTI